VSRRSRPSLSANNLFRWATHILVSRAFAPGSLRRLRQSSGPPVSLGPPPAPLPPARCRRLGGLRPACWLGGHDSGSRARGGRAGGAVDGAHHRSGHVSRSCPILPLRPLTPAPPPSLLPRLLEVSTPGARHDLEDPCPHCILAYTCFSVAGGSRRSPSTCASSAPTSGRAGRPAGCSWSPTPRPARPSPTRAPPPCSCATRR
jgi:hypothetical protein